MSQFLVIVVAAALVNNIVLVQLLGVSSLFAYSNSIRNAVELAWVSAIVMFTTAVANLCIDRWILTPLNLAFLQLILFVTISALFTGLLIRLVSTHWPRTMRRQGLEFYLVSGNGAIIGLALLNAGGLRSIGDNIAYSFGAALGFAFTLVMFAAIRERLATAAVPRAFRGAPIQLLSAGIVAMCLLGFAGLA